MSQKQNKQRKIGKQANTETKGLTQRQRSWIYTSVFIAIVLMLFIVNNAGSEPKEGPYPPNYQPISQPKTEKAADFTLPTVDGKNLKLSDYKGKVVVIDFWATWCGPCRRGIPDLVDLKKKYESKGLEVIGISVDQANTKAQVPSFVKNMGINYPIVYTNDQVPQLYGGIEYIPTSFVIGKNGNILASHQGLVSKQILESEIEKALAAK